MDTLENFRPETASADLPPGVRLAPHGLALTRMLLEEGAERVAVRISGPADLERLRLFVDVFGAARVDALLELREVPPRDPSLAASFGLDPRWEVVSDPDRAAGATGPDADPVALVRAARESGAAHVLLRRAGGVDAA